MEERIMDSENETQGTLDALFDGIQSARDQIEDLAASVRDSASKFSTNAKAAGQRVREQTEAAVESAWDMAEREPVQAAVVTFAVGCALGLLFTALTRRRDY
ncbi:MAG TPA: hypothetical protein VHL34_04770 [Rhizomicrobium sp.]|jgi:ElaB/YqjD/DUF883 family membrane-anchored ribosome-binding protein|nr:hypothetical protein [Rhizomicrobium sp.]